MTDHTLDDVLATLNPHPPESVAALDLADAETALMASIVNETEPAAHRARASHPIRARRRPRRWALAFGAVAAVTAAAAVGFTWIGGAPQQAWGAEARAFADRAQHMLIDGWTVSRADEYDGEGEMTFTNGSRAADLHWRRTTVAKLGADRAASSDLTDHTSLDGTPVTIYRYQNPPVAPGATVFAPGAGSHGRDFTAVWPGGSRTLELRASAGSLAQFKTILAAVHQVPVDRWLAAMPQSVIIPGRRAATVDAMLRDIPIPTGLNIDALREGNAVKERYQLGAQVTGTVACAWFAQLREARTSGDRDAQQTAVDALRGTHRWTVLQEMAHEGGYPDALWQIADVATGAGPAGDGKTASIDEALAQPRLRDALGCPAP